MFGQKSTNGSKNEPHNLYGFPPRGPSPPRPPPASAAALPQPLSDDAQERRKADSPLLFLRRPAPLQPLPQGSGALLFQAGLRGGRAQATSKRWAPPLLPLPLRDATTECVVPVCPYLQVRLSRLQTCRSRRRTRPLSIRFQPRPEAGVRFRCIARPDGAYLGCAVAAPCSLAPDAGAANSVQRSKGPQSQLQTKQRETCVWSK